MKRKIRLILCVMILILAAAGCKKQNSADEKATWSDLNENSSKAEQNKGEEKKEEGNIETKNGEETKGEESNQETVNTNGKSQDGIINLDNQVTELLNGDKVDANSDDIGEEIQYQVGKDMNSFTLKVGEASVTLEGDNFIDILYGMYMTPYTTDPFFLVTESGPSDDYKVYVYEYRDNALEYVGDLGGLPENYQTNGTFSAYVRGKTLQTWFYDAQYYIATYYNEKEDKMESYLAYLPKEMYRVGTVVIALQDIPTYTSRFSDTSEYVIKAGDKVIIAGSDDEEFLYIQSVDQQQAGYVRMKEGYQIQVEDEYINPEDAFKGLWMVD
ncbi:MAG: hypothetical protein E7256_07525 [Lachnospiraceae bacterium]|nr:hypothetical protein [Lachnospiraceae bacterium]